MKLTNYISLSIVLVFLTIRSSAQAVTPEVISTSGDYFTGISATISWTLGEPVIDTYTSTAGILTQGFQQNENVLNEIIENENQLFIEIFPNPFASEINISGIEGHFGISVKDLTGRQVWQSHGKYLGIARVNLAVLESGTYFIIITNETNQQFSKKIIKK